MEPHAILAGKYQLISMIGRGGMGSVWKAEHLALRAPVAVKLMDEGLAVVPEAVGRFLREAQSAAALRSPHVVQILDHGVDERSQVPFIVMELMEGESLAGRVERLRRLSAVETSSVITQVARALARAHDAGVIHRDLKPDNIFLVRNEDEEIAKVLDFGIAKSRAHALAGDAATQTGSVMGTPYYMSPEQISGAKNVDYRSDLWALAVIAYECLTGRRPYLADTVGGLAIQICTRRPERASSFAPVPPGFDAWFDRATAQNIDHRFATARDLAEELRRVCGAEGVPSSASAHTPRSQSLVEGMSALSHTARAETGARASRLLSLWVAIGVGALLIAVAVKMWSTSSPSRPGATASPASNEIPPAPAPTPTVPAQPEKATAVDTAPPVAPTPAPSPPVETAPVTTAPRHEPTKVAEPTKRAAPRRGTPGPKPVTQGSAPQPADEPASAPPAAIDEADSVLDDRK